MGGFKVVSLVGRFLKFDVRVRESQQYLMRKVRFVTLFSPYVYRSLVKIESSKTPRKILAIIAHIIVGSKNLSILLQCIWRVKKFSPIISWKSDIFSRVTILVIVEEMGLTLSTNQNHAWFFAYNLRMEKSRYLFG